MRYFLPFESSDVPVPRVIAVRFSRSRPPPSALVPFLNFLTLKYAPTPTATTPNARPAAAAVAAAPRAASSAPPASAARVHPRRRRVVDARRFRDARSRPVHTDDTDAPVTTTDAIARLGSTRDAITASVTAPLDINVLRFVALAVDIGRGRGRGRCRCRAMDGEPTSNRIESNRVFD